MPNMRCAVLAAQPPSCPAAHSCLELLRAPPRDPTTRSWRRSSCTARLQEPCPRPRPRPRPSHFSCLVASCKSGGPRSDNSIIRGVNKCCLSGFLANIPTSRPSGVQSPHLNPLGLESGFGLGTGNGNGNGDGLLSQA